MLMFRRLKGSIIYKYIFISYWGITVAIILSLLISLLITGLPELDYVKYRTYFTLFGIFMIFYFPRLIFIFFAFAQWIYYAFVNILNGRNSTKVARDNKKNYSIQNLGLIISFLFSFLVVYGMIWEKSNFKVSNIPVYIEDLPKSFEGFKIAQFSDVHLGSWHNAENVRKGLKLINSQSPDIVFFTGDLVNNIVDEMEPYLQDLKQIEAPFGKYSILGNHDMSDYVKWKNFKLKQEYLNKLVRNEEDCGFKMLLNSNVILKIKDDSIALIGVENWGLPPFKQYGDLKKAMEGIENVNVKILLSHDPTHWQEKVVGKTDIDLTLSGHTHGMQMGIDFWGIRWSPIQWIYKHWFGLYQEKSQYLYVNPGFGFLGYPGRFGISPEITILTLHKSNLKQK